MKQKVGVFLKNLKPITMITVTMMIMVTTVTDTIEVLQKSLKEFYTKNSEKTSSKKLFRRSN